MRGLRVARGQRKGAAAAFERLAASAGMKQRLSQPAIQCNSRQSAVAVTSQELKAGIKRPGAQREEKASLSIKMGDLLDRESIQSRTFVGGVKSGGER
jgi:hypothetical protein